MQTVTLDSSYLNALYALIQQTAYERRLDLTELRHRIWEDLSVVPELLLGALENGNLVGFCLGCIREGRGVITLFGVLPEYRRKGVATALFAEEEARLRARGVTQILAEGVGPGYFWPGVEVTRGEAIAFLLKRGFETDRVSRVDMRVDLDKLNLDSSAAISKLAQSGIEIRQAAAADIPAAAAFALQNFSRGWQLEVEDALRFPTPPVNLALKDGSIVGFAVYDVTGYGRFGPTGTRMDMRKQGIGGVLLKECCRQMQARGDKVAEIAWAGPVSFYLKEVNAQIHRVYWGFRKNLSVK